MFHESTKELFLANDGGCKDQRIILAYLKKIRQLSYFLLKFHKTDKNNQFGATKNLIVTLVRVYVL